MKCILSFLVHGALFGGVLALISPVSATITLPVIRLTGAPLQLRCELMENPLGVDRSQPRLSWWVGDPTPDAVQAAYQVVVATSPELLANKPDVWDSGRIGTDQSIGLEYAGPALAPRQRYFWRVRTWNAHGEVSPWSETNWWEMGLLRPEEWHAKWIGHPPRSTAESAPAVLLRREFDVNKPVRRARLYATARGLFEPHLNGDRIGRDFFVPGWTDFALRNQYLTYDVTALLKPGRNALGIVLGDGWHNGYMLSRVNKKNWYGDDTSFSGQLEIEYADGGRETIVTDETWRVATGAILSSDIYNGESYDARQDPGAWTTAGFDAGHWQAPRIVDGAPRQLVAKVSPPVRVQEMLPARTVIRAANGEWVFDVGQNMAGWARIHLRGRAGQAVRLRFAEMLNLDGTLYTANLRSAKATDVYIFARDGEIEWEPHFTYHGFRYVGVSGVDGPLETSAVTGVVMQTDLPATGAFETSDSAVNRLQSNIRWSQRANEFENPTDCPQRDERFGWTGDTQFFMRTATFNFDVSTLFEKWLGDVRDAQQPDGAFTDYAPKLDETNSAPAYSDAGVICPWILYERFGDTRVLAESYGPMKAWIEYQRKNSHDLLRPNEGFGDWLSPDAAVSKYAPTPKDLIGTAYFAYTTELVGRTAAVLGKADEAAHFAGLRAEIGAAFNREFVTAGGRIVGDTQTAYVLALAFDLLPENMRPAAVDHLVDDLRRRQWHVSTGFVGISLLMPVLDRFGRNDAAFHLLQQRSYPSWLYQVNLGATSIWERWNSYSAETGFGDVHMNSFNHTVWGAVGEWLYATVGGIAPDPAAPGFKRFRICPQPGGGITWAKASLDSPHGRIESDWRRDGIHFHLRAKIPPNTRALVELPGGKTMEAGAGEHVWDLSLPTAEQP